jgi:hypothetical protein
LSQNLIFLLAFLMVFSSFFLTEFGSKVQYFWEL